MILNQLRNVLNGNQCRFIGEDTAFRSAVLIPIVEVDGELHIVFEVRSLNMRKQPGDISFPGGKIDPTDKSPLEAALRETYEELGVNPQKVQILGELSPLITSPSFVIYPFVAFINYEDIQNSFNKDEVEEVFTVPIKWLLNYEPYSHLVSVIINPPADLPYEKIINGKEYQWRTRAMEEWFFDYGNYTIWGLTARILKYLIDMLKKSDII
ncbi:MAG: CoA pyrophosphatase [Lysinibacillus sp.]|nr:CoA pyrophosphatase [Lysinibacillus sp.]